MSNRPKRNIRLASQPSKKGKVDKMSEVELTKFISNLEASISATNQELSYKQCVSVYNESWFASTYDSELKSRVIDILIKSFGSRNVFWVKLKAKNPAVLDLL